MKQGIINRATEGMFRYQAWPTVCAGGDGTLYVAVSGHRMGHICPFGKNLMYVSRDGGESWSSPVIINDTPLDDRDAGLTALGGNRLLLTCFHQPLSLYFDNPEWLRGSVEDWKYGMVEATLDAWRKMPDAGGAGSFTRLSEDGGKTWTPARQAPVSAPHGPIRRRNGSLLFLGKEFHSGRAELEPGAIYAFESRDEGAAWILLSRLDFPDGCGRDEIHEPCVLELPNGSLLGMLRGQGTPVAFGFSIFSTFSDDGGNSWTKPEPLNFCGSPPHLLLHSGGKVILTYGRRMPPGMGVRARISGDGGRTWGEELILSTNAPDGDLGYPSSVELPGGEIFTVYYQKLPGDRDPSILYTRWNI